MSHWLQLGEGVPSRRIHDHLPGTVIGCQHLRTGIPGGAIGCQSEGARPISAVAIGEGAGDVGIQSIGLVNYLIADGQKWAIIEHGDREILALAVVVSVDDGCGHVDRQRIVGVGAVWVSHRLQLGEGISARRIDHQLPGAVIGCQHLRIGVPGGAVGAQAERSRNVGTVTEIKCTLDRI